MTTATITQIAQALGISVQAIHKRRKKNRWQAINDTGVDRFDIEQIGLEAKQVKAIERYLDKSEKTKAIVEKLDKNLPAPQAAALPVVARQIPTARELTGRQQKIVSARSFFVTIIDRSCPDGKGVTEVIRSIMKRVEAGDSAYVANAELANDRRRKNGKLISETSLWRFWTGYLAGGKKPESLAPQDNDAKRVERETALTAWVRGYAPGQRGEQPQGVPAWLPWLLDAYRKPQKPSLADALRRLRRERPEGITLPTETQARRILKKIPLIYQEKGRMTGAELNSIKFHVVRDASMFRPFTICQIDGHSFKAYVAHPTTGAHFHPEICGVICLTTKVLGGWSWGVAESRHTVADAYRHCCTINEEKPWGSVPAILEADRGSGNLAKTNSDEFTGLFARMGTTFEPPENGGNPQGRGAIERSNQSIWIRAAKELLTYTGKDMDRGVRKKVYTKLEKDLKAVKKLDRIGAVAKTSDLLMAPDEFTEFLRQVAITYNNTPHRALPKITAPPPGEPEGRHVRRHMTPFEALAMHVEEGWKPTAPPAEMLDTLFMPHVTIPIRRGKFTLNGNKYAAPELEEYHMRDLIAAYDIHDARQVWVMDMDERLICTADWEGNRVFARPIPVADQAVMQRENTQVKNLTRKLDLVHAAAKPAQDVLVECRELPPEVLEYEARQEEEARQKVISLENKRKFKEVQCQADVYEEIRAQIKAGTVTAYQKQWKKDFEYWEDSGGKIVGLMKEDPYCLKDPEDERNRKKESEG